MAGDGGYRVLGDEDVELDEGGRVVACHLDRGNFGVYEVVLVKVIVSELGETIGWRVA